jgi:hypothetical protein
LTFLPKRLFRRDIAFLSAGFLWNVNDISRVPEPIAKPEPSSFDEEPDWSGDFVDLLSKCFQNIVLVKV